MMFNIWSDATETLYGPDFHRRQLSSTLWHPPKPVSISFSPGQYQRTGRSFSLKRGEYQKERLVCILIVEWRGRE